MTKTLSVIFLSLAKILALIGVLLIIFGEATYLFTHPNFWQAVKDIRAEYDPFNLVSFFTRLLFFVPAGIAYSIHLLLFKLTKAQNAD